MTRLPLAFVLSSILLGTAAQAAPDPGCARRFIGVWRHSGGGMSNIATLTADGTAACSGNAFCQQGTWSCQGNVMNYVNASGSWNYQLVSPNQMVLPGTGITVDRMGAASAEAQSSLVDGVLAGRRRTNAGLDDRPAAPPRPAPERGRQAATEAREAPCSVVSGAPVATACADEWGGERSCKCIPLTNNCSVPATQRYFVSTARNARSVSLAPGETKTEACTSQRGSDVTLGEYRISGGSRRR